MGSRSFQGTTTCATEVGQLLLNLGGVAENLSLFNIPAPYKTTSTIRFRHIAKLALVDCDAFTCAGFQQTHSRPTTATSLYAKVIFPLCSAVVIFADKCGGLASASRVLAGLARFSPVLEIKPPPCLFVISRKEYCTEKDFNRMVTTELLCMIREEHPESPHSFNAVQRMWLDRIDHLRILSKVPALSFSHILEDLEEVTRRRANHGFGLSETSFDRLLNYAVDSISDDSHPLFDTLTALGVRNPVHSHAREGLKTLFNASPYAMSDRVAIAASCIAFYAYGTEAYGMAQHIFRRERLLIE